MRAINKKKTSPAWLTGILCIVLAALGIVYFAGYGTKWMTVIAGAGIIFLAATGDLKRLKNLPALLLLGYAAFSWLTVFWAMSGKFHLREFSKIFIALLFFLLIALRKEPDRAFARRVMGVISGISALYALMSVEAAATGLCKDLLQRLPGLADLTMEFNASRLYGIFGNSNIEASIYAIGILFSAALLCGSEKKRQRILFAVTLSFNAFAFLLVFSMGAIVCFAAAVIVYLLAAGSGRGAALVRMLEAALPTVAFVFLATRFFNREGSEAAALLLMLLNAAVSVVLELLTAGKLSAVLTEKQKLTFGVIAAVVLLLAGYAVIGLRITGAYTFGEEFYRTEFLEPGEHTLELKADGDVMVFAFSQNRLQIIQNGYTALYFSVPEGKVSFAVPEDTELCSFRFQAEPGTVLHSAVLDGQQELPLYYKLLPGFAANRVQNLTESRSQLLRKMYREDGMKLFRLSPAAGNGVGAFETGVTAVQDFPYETRYIHNHYVQVLLEDGVIGFTLFAVSLLAMVAVLWKKRKQVQESEFFWIYPALCAEFVMNGAQMLWDVSMSMIVFTCMTYAVYGLIVGICAEPIGKKEAAAEETPKKAKKKTADKQPEWLFGRIAGITLTAIILLTLCGNLYANRLENKKARSLNAFFSNLEQAVKLDLYERNDAKLSYVMAVLENDEESHRDQADRYAQQLSRVQSNTIPRYLVAYYLHTGRYETAIDEAILGAAYSATNAETWNASISLLKQALLDSGADSPLLTDGETLMPKLMAYYDALQKHNASALVPVELDENAQMFFDKVLALKDCVGDAEAAAAVLMGD